ncbi:MAG: helix-turn-helix domain-containing protein [Ignavibacteria bacterium]|jgi:transcriptional regulator with XRE-family HTH domain|nr:helix-turn-helix domain-containing protein [Ignavibacteria bacterium]
MYPIDDNNDLNSLIGLRVKAFRCVFNEGMKLTSEQFSHLLDITREQLGNYENGRSNLPVSVLLKLYKRGANPVYIISGEGDLFANNKVGIDLRNRILQKEVNYMESVTLITKEPMKADIKMTKIKAAAGKIIVK